MLVKCCCLYLVLQMLKYFFECSCDFEGKKASMIFVRTFSLLYIKNKVLTMQNSNYFNFKTRRPRVISPTWATSNKNYLDNLVEYILSFRHLYDPRGLGGSNNWGSNFIQIFLLHIFKLKIEFVLFCFCFFGGFFSSWI